MSRSATDEALLTAARTVMRVCLRAADGIGGTSVVQLRALSVLGESGPVNLTRLADGMGVTPSTSSRLVDRLVAAGLVAREPSAANRREIALSLTEAGARMLDHYDELRLAGLQESLGRLPGPVRAQVEDVLTGLGESGR